MKIDNSLEALVNPGETENFFDLAGLAPFEASARTGYHRTNALWLAEFSRLIYRRERDELPARPPGFRTRDAILSAHGWREEPGDFFNLGSTQAALFTCHAPPSPCGALVFRGTLGLADFITDSQFLLVDWLPAAGKVHRGFRNEFRKIWPQLEARLARFPHPVFYAGHSLGGALATLAASCALLERQVPAPAAVYSFGSPRVGDAAFTRTLAGVLHCRIVNDKDIVPTLPPPPLYKHAGERHWIRPDGRLELPSVAPETAEVSPPKSAGERTAAALHQLLANLPTLSFGLPENLTDHAPANYLARLEAAG